MSTKTTPSTWNDVNLSQYHAGQIVTPQVQWRFAGRDRYEVRYWWDDASLGDNQIPDWTHFAGEYWTVIKHLASEGIFTDDHRF